jgi:hypothetical protein
MVGRLLGEARPAAEVLDTARSPLAPEDPHRSPGRQGVGHLDHRSLLHGRRERAAPRAGRVGALQLDEDVHHTFVLVDDEDAKAVHAEQRVGTVILHPGPPDLCLVTEPG